MESNKMPSIQALRKIVKDIEYLCEESKLPELSAIGTVKLHGTNASILYNTTKNTINPQKKSGIINTDNDNFGFAQFIDDNTASCIDIIDKIKLLLTTEALVIAEYITIFGEWAGKGIQKKIAISELPKAFYMFGIHIKNTDKSDYWLSSEIVSQLTPQNPIYNLYHFKTYPIKINFNRITDANDLMKTQLDEVENEDPVAKSFGVSGVGEGIVYVIDNYKGKRFIWKVKGEKHAHTGKSKVKSKDGCMEKVVDSTRENFLDTILPNWRLEQGIIEIFGESKLLDRHLYGNYLKWINQDIVKEEMDRIEGSDYKLSDLYKDIQRRAINFIKSNY
jgi:hypothetical protein